MMNCIKCGKEIPDGARFCNFCGVKQELTCPSCGTALPDGSAFCHMCGNPVKSETNPEPPSDPYADLDPYAYLDVLDPDASLYEQKPAPKEETSEAVEDFGENWGDGSDLVEAIERLEKIEKLEKLRAQKDPVWQFFHGDRDDEESEESEESEELAEEEPFDDALFEELIEDEKPELNLPNEQNFEKLFQIIGRTSRARRQYNWITKKNDGPWELEIQLRWNDDYRKNTDPDYRCYGCFSIIKKDPKHHYECDDNNGTGYYIKSGYYGYSNPKPAFPGLENLMAYALSDSGIYYVTKDGEICFLDSEDGTMQVLGNQKNVISLNYDAGVLTVIYVKNRRQTGYDKHRDECGGYTEAWYDIYELDVGEFDIQHPD